MSPRSTTVTPALFSESAVTVLLKLVEGGNWDKLVTLRLRDLQSA